MNKIPPRIWRFISTPEQTPQIEHLRKTLGVSPLVAQLLVNRDLVDPDRASRFLDPRLTFLTPPDRMFGMDLAVARIIHALASQERVRVFGDYDVDGQTSTSILYLFLRAIGLKVDWELPHRHRDGYGLNPQAVDRASNEGVTLLVTCDCGISNAAEVSYALEKGIETIVIDHHRTPPELPPAVAVLNPHQPDCEFPFKGLCAAGVSFYLCAGVRTALRAFDIPAPDLREVLDLVALGTIADMVPLIEENRIFVKNGLEQLSHPRRTGVKAIKTISRLSDGNLTSTDVGYKIAPRLNAGGRMDDAGRGVRLLTTGDSAEASMLAEELDQENISRREIERQIFEDAVNQVEAQKAANGELHAIVLGSPEWHHGVIGIVCSRLVERYNVPVALMTIEGDRARGSARSVPGFHLFEEFSKFGEIFLRFGGHAAAAGFSILPENIPLFADRMNESVKNFFPENIPPRELRIEAEVNLSYLDTLFYDQVWSMSPFGPENPEPIFLAKNLQVRSSRIVGQNHLKVQFDDLGILRSGIGFGMADLHPLQGPVDVAFYAQKNEFRGKIDIELRICDIRPSAKPKARGN